MQERRLRLQSCAAQRTTFGLPSGTCELLVAFLEAGSLSKLAAAMGRDASVISRQLQRAAQLAPVLEKQQGRWHLTALGRQLCQWTHDAATTQRRVLREQTVVRIASTREFAARVLAPTLGDLLAGTADTALSILAAEEGVERMLIDGRADLGFDCGSPTDPAIRFKTVVDEAFSVVASPRLLGRRRVDELADLLALPHLQYQRASAPKLMQLSYEVPNVLATFNDIASIREACCAGHGWAVLPAYSVARELASGQLRRLPGWKIRSERFGVWWMRGRQDLEPWVQRAIRWLGLHPLE